MEIRNIFPMNSDKIGAIIHERRVYLNLTQNDLAEMAGITFKSVSEIELGTRNPTLNTLNRILDVLGLAISVHIKTMNQ
jgi:y4mF family transcriptional regulator